MKPSRAPTSRSVAIAGPSAATAALRRQARPRRAPARGARGSPARSGRAARRWRPAAAARRRGRRRPRPGRLGQAAPPGPRLSSASRSVATSISSGSGRLSIGMSGPSQGSSSLSCSARSTIRTERTPGVGAQHVERRPRLLLDLVLGGDDLQRRGLAGRRPARWRRAAPAASGQRQRQHREEGEDRREEAERASADQPRRRHQRERDRVAARASASRAVTRPSRRRLPSADPPARRAAAPAAHPHLAGDQGRVVGGDQHGLAHAVELDQQRHQPAAPSPGRRCRSARRRGSPPGSGSPPAPAPPAAARRR